MAGFKYTQPAEAANVITAREQLRKLVEEWWAEKGLSTPFPWNGRPSAVMARSIASFSYEEAVFVRMAESLGLKPRFCEYQGDSFVTKSPSKLRRIIVQFYERSGRKGGLVLRKHVLTSPTMAENELCGSIKMYPEKGTVVGFHHNLLASHTGMKPEDMTEWLHAVVARRHLNSLSSQYYPWYLSRFLAHEVLMEDYHGGESGIELSSFLKMVFEPAVAELQKLFGATPVIVPLPWHADMGIYPPPESDWRLHYPSSLAHFFKG